jgi:protein-tyrosine phosphatase
METRVVKLDPHKADIDKIREAAALVDGGRLVAFPTETVYGIACRVAYDSLKKLNTVKKRDPGKHYSLHIGQKSELRKYVPRISFRAQKLVEHTWPGPLTVVFELTQEDLTGQRRVLAPEVFDNLYKSSFIGIRYPDHPIASILLRSTHHPVVAPSANVAGESPAVEPEQVSARFSGQIDLLLDAGPCKYARPSTVVRVTDRDLEVLRPGVYSKADIRKVSTVGILFVCTGNTCRSPMAEGMFRRYLAEKLECSVDQLEEMGYKIMSAGVMNTAGGPASKEAVATCEAKGIDIEGHRSKTISPELIDQSDLIFVMERMHCNAVTALNPEAANKCMLLAHDGDIADPIGQPREYYHRCAQRIERAVKQRLGEVVK